MTVIVTGAAGSIGSAVCQQLVRTGVKDIVLIDIAETPLFWLEEQLKRAPGVTVRAFICNVSARDQVARVFQEVQPTAVIHCAALKHVGVCERNVCQAILTNLWGSWVVAELAALGGARCVIASTDKAVNPTSVMGMTKHVAERIAAGFADTRIVRLVNVHGSAGSVVPIFEHQIAMGGPVTLTHPDVTRLFMTVEAAARLLVEQAMSPPRGVPMVEIPDEVKVVRIGDLASDMIGSRDDIQITVIGLRPGEKLNEECLTGEERARMIDGSWFEAARPSWVLGGACQQLMTVAGTGDEAQAHALLQHIVSGGY